MAGIYIHIPFCKKACHYCNFHFSTSLKLKNDFIPALLKEISLQHNYLNGERIDTVYFGGGTPSLLEKHELATIFEALHKHYTIAGDVETTLEANPDDITSEKLNDWRKNGINRLSIGIQSFFDEDLQWMNRVHSAEQAITSILKTQNAGFDNITIDLIYGTPILSDEKWKENVATAVQLQIPHLSCYALTVEPDTALQKMILLFKKEPVEPEKQAGQFLQLMDWLEEAGYEHYEISNFSKPGYRSRHNTAYWNGQHYLGLGPSAHSFNGSSRQWSIANNPLYIQSLLNNHIPFEIEMLSPNQKLNEYIMTSLRTSEGLNLGFVGSHFGVHEKERVTKEAVKFIHSGKIKEAADFLKLTREGKLFADGIAADFFTDNY